MATTTISVSCSDCTMAGTAVCDDCLVTFVVDGARPPIDRRCSSHGRQPPALVPERRSLRQCAVGTAGDGSGGVVLMADEAQAIRRLSDAGLVGSLRFVPRRSGA